MTPSNRRVKKPELPPDVMDLETDETLPLPSVRGSVPPSRKPASMRPASAKSEAPAPPTKKPKVTSRAMRILRGAVGTALILNISGFVAWGARKYVKTTPRFAVTDVVVSGARRRTADEILLEAGIQKGANVFTLDLERARHKLLGDPWVSDAQLARRLPGTIYVQVTERQAAGLVALGETYLATREGEIFKKLEPGDPTDFPIVTGLAVEKLAEDREGCSRSIRRALELAGEYERTSLASRAPLQEVHLSDDGSTSLIVGKSGTVLQLGEPPFRRKLEQAAKVFAELDRRGAKADALMLDNEGRPDRVVVRMR